MALKIRLRMLSIAKPALVLITTLTMLAAAGIAHAGEPAPATQSGMMFQVIICLFGALDTILTGVIVWLVSNQSESFRRIGALETGEEVRKELCAERHPKNK